MHSKIVFGFRSAHNSFSLQVVWRTFLLSLFLWIQKSIKESLDKKTLVMTLHITWSTHIKSSFLRYQKYTDSDINCTNLSCCRNGAFSLFFYALQRMWTVQTILVWYIITFSELMPKNYILGNGLQEYPILICYILAANGTLNFKTSRIRHTVHITI